jgi:hypothetical protein
VPNVAHAGTYFHHWVTVTVARDDAVLVATCSAPEDVAEAAEPICEAFLANVRFVGDAP